jgi:hypothetical protein
LLAGFAVAHAWQLLLSESESAGQQLGAAACSAAGELHDQQRHDVYGSIRVVLLLDNPIRKQPAVQGTWLESYMHVTGPNAGMIHDTYCLVPETKVRPALHTLHASVLFVKERI